MSGLVLLNINESSHQITRLVASKLYKFKQINNIKEVCCKNGQIDHVKIFDKHGSHECAIGDLDNIITLRENADSPYIACPLVLEDPSDLDNQIKKLCSIFNLTNNFKKLGLSLYIIINNKDITANGLEEKIIKNKDLPEQKTIFICTGKDQSGNPIDREKAIQNTADWIFGSFLILFETNNLLPKHFWPGSQPYNQHPHNNSFVSFGIHELKLYPGKEVAKRWQQDVIFENLKGLIEKSPPDDNIAEFGVNYEGSIAEMHNKNNIIKQKAIPIPDDNTPLFRSEMEDWYDRYFTQCDNFVSTCEIEWIKSIKKSVAPIRATVKNQFEKFQEELVDFENRIIEKDEYPNIYNLIKNLRNLELKISKHAKQTLQWDPPTPFSEQYRSNLLKSEIENSQKKLKRHTIKSLLVSIFFLGILPILAGLSLFLPFWVAQKIILIRWVDYLMYPQVILILFGFLASTIRIILFLKKRKKIVKELTAGLQKQLNKKIMARYRNILSNLIKSGDIRIARMIGQMLRHRIYSWSKISTYIHPPTNEIDALAADTTDFDQLGSNFIRDCGGLHFRNNYWRKFVKNHSSGVDPHRSFERNISQVIYEKAIRAIKKQECIKSGMALRAISKAGLKPEDIPLNSKFVIRTAPDQNIFFVPKKLSNDLASENMVTHHGVKVVISNILYERIIFLKYKSLLPSTAFEY